MRPTCMRNVRTTALALTGVLALVGCGEAERREVPPSAVQWRDCTIEQFVDLPGPVVARLRGGGGERVVVKLGTGTGPCAGGLVVRDGGGVNGTDVERLDLDPSTAQVVTLAARDGEPGRQLLRIDSRPHARGGFQPHLFSLYDGVAELVTAGRPLLPFVATDGGAAPMTATCNDAGGIDVLTATTSEPPGVVLAWDVRRTSYQVDEGEADQVGSKQILDHAADPVLRRELPQLFELGALLVDCAETA